MVILNTSKLLNKTLENLYVNKALSLMEASSGNFKMKVLLKPNTKLNLTDSSLVLPKVIYSISLVPKFSKKHLTEADSATNLEGNLFLELKGYDQEVSYSFPKEEYNISYYLIKTL